MERWRPGQSLGPEARRILLSFLLFAGCFSLNHGTVAASIPLAASEFGSRLGSYQLGTLYIFYSAVALTVSAAIVQTLGQKRALVSGLGLYCCYVIAFFLAREAPAAKWPIALLGAALGGSASGFLWTAQGGYFTVCSRAYARAAGVPVEAGTARLAGLFATVYLGFEVLLKLLSSLLQVLVCGDAWSRDVLTGSCEDAGRANRGKLTVFLVYSILALTATGGMCLIPMITEEDAGLEASLLHRDGAPRDTEAAGEAAEATAEGDASDAFAADQGPPRGARQRGAQRPVDAELWDRALDAIRLLCRSRKMQLMTLTNFAFGFLAAFMNTYVVSDEVIPAAKVGYYVAIIPLVATVASLPLGYLSERTGRKAYAMVLGGLCFFGFALTFAAVEDAATLRRAYVLVPLFMVFGVGRAVWEGPNKAVFADFFEEKSEAAFANLILQNGGSSALAFFLYPALSTTTKEYLCLATAALAVPAYLLADELHRREKLA